MRTFDLNAQYESIKKAATDATKSIFPIEGKTRILRLESVSIPDKLSTTDYTGQSKVKSEGGTWGTPVFASLTLIDKATGHVIDKMGKVRLFTLPEVTPRASYIVGGNEYQVHNQLRLKSGAYTQKKQNGELKTFINLAQGKNFDLTFNEDKGTFNISKIGGGQANIPLYPVLTYLGVSASAIDGAWGAEIGRANAMGANQKAVEKTATAFGIKAGTELKDYFAKTKLDPDTSKTTLGNSFDKVSGEMLLAASKKLLDVHLGKKPSDDRDSMEFKEIHSLEDFIKERLEKNKDTLAFKIRRSIDHAKRTKISQIVNPGAFNSVIESFFTQDDKSATPEQTNPLEMLSGLYKATIMGSGGISSDHAVTDDMRNIHPSHYGFIDPVHTPESSRIGANLHLPLGVIKDGRELKSIVVDKAGKSSALTATQAYNVKIAFPGQTGDTVKVMYRGNTVMVPKNSVDYFTPSPQALFSWSTNLIPFLPADQGNRSMMAAKMMEQAISLKHREAPLVQVGAGSMGTLEENIGGETAVKSPIDGVIKKLTADYIVIKGKDGDHKIGLYNHFSLNRKSYLNHEPLVKEGDKVKAGQLLADSNFSKKGVLALGTNLKTAYIPYKGLNFDDGIVITNTAAEKLTSVHIHKKAIDADENTKLSLSAFRTQYPSAILPENVKKLGDDGVIKVGQKVKMGDVLIAALQNREASKDIGVIQKQLADRPKDASVVWSQDDEGVVQDIQRIGNTTTVFIKTEEKAKIGDKLAGRHGNKGIITKIIEDHEAPKNAAGEPIEIILNPHGVISRINIGQMYESAAAKVAKKLGKPVVTKNFSGEDYLKTTKELLEKNGVDDKEELFDADGKSLGQVHVGNPYILKLFKLAQGNYSVRQGGPGSGYDVNLQPLKAGGDDSAKSLDLLTTYSMLSHGSRANLREMATTKANQNDEYWKALKSGQTLPPPQPTLVYNKFISYLKGAGIDVKKDGTKLTLAPLTDKQVREMSSGEVKKPVFYRGKDMEPIKDGLMDHVKFGGFKGTRWGHIELKEAVVNPVFENAVRKITGLGAKFDEIMAGKLHLDKHGELNKEGAGVTGGAAIEKILKDINVEEDIKLLQAKALKATGSVLDDVNKRLRYLLALKKLDMKPHEAYMRRVVPVVPPLYRPMYPLPDGSMTTSGVNLMYQNLGILNLLAKNPVVDMLPEADKAALRSDIYEHVRGLSGITDLNIKGRERMGFISEIKGGNGGQPKEGFFIAKGLSKRQDFVGRGTIIPEPSLGIDEVALPEPMAWKLFEPFVVRELAKFGKTPNQAIDEIKVKSELAKKALDIVLKSRHVLLNRAPSLHKFSIMAFKPKMTSGTAIKVPPLVGAGFNLDYDGDTMVVHTPISDEANLEAAKMLPSKNLYKPGNGKLMISPSQEAQTGIFYLSKTDAGRKVLNKILGPKHPVMTVLDKKNTEVLLNKLSKEETSNEFARIVQELKTAGEEKTYSSGFTLGLNDLQAFKKEREAVLSHVNTQVGKAKNEGDMIKINSEATALIDKIMSAKLKDKNNPLFDMVESGAKGSKSQLRAILMSPMFVSNSKGNIVRSAIKNSYTEGLDIGDYWTSMYGARRGMMDRAIQTSLPGAFSKNIMANTIDNVVSAQDCGTKKGIVLGVDDADAAERYLASDQGGVARNTLVDHMILSKLKKAGLKTILVRSPLTCLQPKGVCAKCYGLDEAGHIAAIGDNVGAKAGQTISEPLVQLVMNCSEGTITDASGKVWALQDYYESFDIEEVDDGHCRSKKVNSKICDFESVVDVSSVQTHMPEDDMYFIKTGSGHSMLVQGNHPIWVYNENGKEKEIFARDAIVGAHHLKNSRCAMSGSEDSPVDPYLIGIYTAEGTTRYGNGTKKYEGVAVATIITQSNLAIKNKIFEVVKDIPGATKYAKDVQIYNPKFAKKMASIVRGREAKVKRLMPGFNLWKESDMVQVLAGMIDGDGSARLNTHKQVVAAKIYTSSYVLIQQIEIMCEKLGYAYSPLACGKRPLQKSQQFVAEIRFTDSRVHEASVKLSQYKLKFLSYLRHEKSDMEPITLIKKAWTWDIPVWDVKTSSKGFICGMIRNHNTFHTGGAAGTGADVGGYKRIDQLLNLPKIIPGAAALAPKNGTVDSIKPGIAGGYDIDVGGLVTHSPQGRDLCVKVGDHVTAGDAMSEGVVKPQDLVKHKGMQPAQEYIVNELKKAYGGQGVKIHRKVFETVMRSLGNTTQVLNNPKQSDFVAGDIIPYTVAQHHNENLVQEVPVGQSTGYTLNKSYGALKKGDEITSKDSRSLEASGHVTVEILKDAIKHAPLLKSVTTLPLLKRNWMSALGFRQLAKALTEGASQSWETDTSDYHPIPAFMYGATFGKGKDGKY